jgi:magnesium transporter
MSDVEERPKDDARLAADLRDHEQEPHDEDGKLKPGFVASVAKAINERDRDALRDLVGDMHEADLGGLIEALDPDLRAELIAIMGRDFDFTALTEVDENIRDEIIEELPNSAVALYVQDLESDDAVALLEDLDAEDRQEILEALPPIDRAALKRSLDFPENSAGRLMQTTVVTVPPFWTAGQAINLMRDSDADDLPDQFYEVFVVDPAHRLLGNVFLDALLRAKPDTKLGDMMRTDRRRVPTDEDAEDVAELIREEADQEIKALGGVSGDETLSDRVWEITRSRFLWLFVNLITAFIASSVLDAFNGQLQKMVALAVLAPIVASQGGNGATQTMTVVIRALATRELSRLNAARVIGREMLVGALNGIAFGIITGIGAWIWFHQYGLGVVIAGAMLTNLVAGAVGGIVIPLVLEFFEVDPAVSSSAFVTTVTDVVGYSSFLGFATLWFRLG